MAFPIAALYVGAILMVPGILFMLKNVDLVKTAVADAKITSASPEMIGIGAYYLYLAGMSITALGAYSLELAMGVPPPLAATAAVSGPLSVLIYMAVAGHSITGIPGVTGPPLPGKIIIGVVGLTLNTNAVMMIMEGAGSLVPFASVYVFLIAVLHLIAFKHRSTGWNTAMV